MAPFTTAVVSYPTVIFTALLAVVAFYWLLAIVGLVDLDVDGLDVDVQTQADGDATDLPTLASWLVALGLQGVPVSVVFSLIVLLAWMLSCLGGMWLVPLVPGTLFTLLDGTLVAAGSLALAVVGTNRLVKPLRKLFVTHRATANADLVGHRCKVLTGHVDERSGRAEVQQHGANLNIRVWAATPNALARGSSARIVDYDAAGGRYRIEPEA